VIRRDDFWDMPKVYQRRDMTRSVIGFGVVNTDSDPRRVNPARVLEASFELASRSAAHGSLHPHMIWILALDRQDLV
jgi:hypothetical protein